MEKLAISLTFLTSLIKSQTLYKPIMISEIFRHGARTAYGDDQSEYVKEIGVGNLTGNGQRMHFLLGQQVKENYKDLFNYDGTNKISNYDYLLYSSSVQRCIVSGNSHLLGIFPPGEFIGDKITAEKNSSFNVLPDFQGTLTVGFQNDSKSALPVGARVFPVLTKNAEEDYYFFPGCLSCPAMANQSEGYRESNSVKYQSELNVTIKVLQDLGYDPKIVNREKWDMIGIYALYDIVR